MRFGLCSSSARNQSHFVRAPLVDLEEFIPGLAVELRYASARHFLGKRLYDSPRALLVEPVARRLAAVEHTVRQQGFGLKVWDAFRPRAAQERMWAACPDPRFVAPPDRGSRHTRGVAVDVTLLDRSTGLELPMGTDFDAFVLESATECPTLPAEVRWNRCRLRDWMESGGFEGIASEWWHFHARDWEAFPLLD